MCMRLSLELWRTRGIRSNISGWDSDHRVVSSATRHSEADYSITQSKWSGILFMCISWYESGIDGLAFLSTCCPTGAIWRIAFQL